MHLSKHSGEQSVFHSVDFDRYVKDILPGSGSETSQQEPLIVLEFIILEFWWELCIAVCRNSLPFPERTAMSNSTACFRRK